MADIGQQQTEENTAGQTADSVNGPIEPEKEIANVMCHRNLLYSWRRGRESNPQHRKTKPVCYRYTTPQYLEAMLNEVEKRTSGRIGEATHQTPLEAIPEIHKLVPFPFQLIPAAAQIPKRHSAELKVHIQTVR